MSEESQPESPLGEVDLPLETSKLRIPARMLTPFSQNSNSSNSPQSQQSSQCSQARLQQVPMFQRMHREIKRLKRKVFKLKNEKSESDEKAKRYLAQNTLTSYGIKCLKTWSGGASPKLLKDIPQQMADTFYTPVIIKKTPKIVW